MRNGARAWGMRMRKKDVVNECMIRGSVADIQVNYFKEMQHASTDVLFEPLNDGNALNF